MSLLSRFYAAWQDYPATSTPATAAALNRIDDRIDELQGIVTQPGSLAALPPGSPFTVMKVGSNWTYPPGGATITARPTARTDLVMHAINPVDGTVPPFAVSDLDLVFAAQ